MRVLTITVLGTFNTEYIGLTKFALIDFTHCISRRGGGATVGIPRQVFREHGLPDVRAHPGTVRLRASQVRTHHLHDLRLAPSSYRLLGCDGPHLLETVHREGR